jgi:hypothetical protein
MFNQTADSREKLFTELETRFNTLKDEYARLDADADSNVVRWRYAQRPAFDLRPDFFRRFNQKPGDLTDDEPVTAFLYYAYGYSADERVIYAAVFQTEAVPRIATFYQHYPDRIELASYAVTLYTEDYHLRKVGWLVQPSEDRPVIYAEYEQDAGEIRFYYEEYVYDEQGRLARIPTYYVTQLRSQRAETHSEAVYQYEGDRLIRITSRLPGSQERVLYEARRKGETKKTLFEAARVSLREVIVERVRLDPATRQERVYNLVISYDAVADDGLLLTVAPEAQREAWERETSDQSYESLLYHQLAWQPEQIEIWSLPEEYERFLRQTRRDERWDDIRSLFIRVARDLNEQDWSGLLNVTDDFIVFANDYEAGNDVHDAIRASVPMEKLRILQAKGLID